MQNPLSRTLKSCFKRSMGLYKKLSKETKNRKYQKVI